MKIANTLIPCLSLIAYAATASATEAPNFSQKTLYSCEATKWHSVRIVEQKDTGETSYSLIVETASRERPAVGAYVEGQSQVVFGLTKVSQGQDGSIVFAGNYSGTQPVNTSQVSLVGKPTGQGQYAFELVEGPHHVEITPSNGQDVNYAYGFFKDRIKTLLVDDDAVEEGKLLCGAGN